MFIFESRKPSVVNRRVRVVFLAFGVTMLVFVLTRVSVLASQGKMHKIDEFVEVTHYIHSKEELEKIAAKNMSGHYILMSNIEINGDSPLYDNNKTLYGSIDGNGFNITFKGNITHSFLYKVASSGVIKNLGVVYDDSCTFSIKGDNFGGLTFFNEGKIEDSFVVGNFDLDKNHIVGGVSAINSGEIKHVYSKISVIEDELNLDRYVIGGITGSLMSGKITQSYGEVHSNYVSNYLDDIINDNKPNPVIGNFVGSKAKETILEDLYAIDYHYPYIDRNYEGVNLLEKYFFDENNVFTSDTYGLRFSSSTWNFNDLANYENLLIDNCSVKEGK